jgi:hypothetical protein
MKKFVFAVTLSIACGSVFAAEHQIKMLNAGADGSSVEELCHEQGPPVEIHGPGQIIRSGFSGSV